jgi:hypothetical protein
MQYAAAPPAGLTQTNPTVRTARIAGAWYLLLIVASLFSFIYGGSLVVEGNPAATAHNLEGSETVYRVSVVAALLAAVVWILLARALYRLLSPVHRGQASLMVTFVVVSVPLSFLEGIDQLGALTVIQGGGYLSAFSQSQLQAAGLLLIELSRQVADVNSIFFGLWLLPFGVLVYRSGFIPRVFGVLLVINCFAYLAISLVAMLGVPAQFASIYSKVVLLPQAAGELSIMAWLLIRGANLRSPRAVDPASA